MSTNKICDNCADDCRLGQACATSQQIGSTGGRPCPGCGNTNNKEAGLCLICQRKIKGGT